MAAMARPGSPGTSGSHMNPQNLSKRDKKRNNIVEKLEDMISTFKNDKSQHYRVQLQAIQVDMTLVIRADPYEDAPLEDNPAVIQELVDAVMGDKLPSGKAAREDFYALAGRRYYQYCQEINQAQEKRDADLTMLKIQYDNAYAELERTKNFKIQVAQREHQELASTIRQRLINTVTKKRDRLLREKDQFDISDSNSLLLHPNHYSMNTTASPGGIHSTRKTRLTRQRLGELDDERGKKRKVPSDEEEERPTTQEGPSPYQMHRAKTLSAQQEAPAYSIDSLFTEKELAHASNIAQFATQHFFQEQQKASTINDPTTNESALVANTIELPNGSQVESAAMERQATQPESTAMERQVSNYATRGATRGDPFALFSDGTYSFPQTTINPFLPAMIAITKTDKGAPTPPGASSRDIQMDLTIMTKTAADKVPSDLFSRGPVNGNQNNDLTVGEARDMFLQQACREPLACQPFRLPLTDLGPALIKDGVNRTGATGFADPACIPIAPFVNSDNIPVSRATSVGLGSADVGGAAMRRTRSRPV